MRVERAVAGTVVAAACLISGSGAYALEQVTVAATLSTAAATMSPATAVTATVNCPNAKKGDVLVQWTASPSPFVTGYTVTRTAGGVTTTLTTLGATATAYDDKTVAGGTTYVYGVIATYRLWTSAAANAPAVTTAHRC